jgi:dTDP-4-dehydrorhamnose reductase
MSKPTILVTGANGQLGKELQLLSPLFNEFDFVFFSREDLEIQDADQVSYLFDIHLPKYFINCAAYTAVDMAESEIDLAMQVNGEAVGHISAECKEHDTRLIHISTDYVFDGAAGKPYDEKDDTNPINVYGRTKLQGEKLAFKFNPETIVIRTSWVYSSFGKNFVKTMIRLMNEKESISVVNDQFGSPTYAADLAELIMQVLSSGKFQPGIYHFTGDGIISWYEFALAIKGMTNSNCQVIPTPSSSYPTPAKRPLYGVLDKEKIKGVYQVKLKPWLESLEKCIKLIRES